MSGAAENTDPLTVLNSSIHLNEEDWLQFLQKLTPTSIENLQQTLKRLQQRESSISSSDKLSFLATASQLCGSSVLPSSTNESTRSTGQTTPIVMSLGVSKAPVPSVITVPSVLNAAKSVTNAMPSTIVLPSSALLIAPSGHGQTFSLDSGLSSTGLNRLVVTSGDLLNTASGSSGPCVPSSLPSPLSSTTTPSNEAFNSLNTLATAAVAVAASSTKQNQWPSGSGCSSKETTSMDVVTSFPQVFDSVSVPCTTSPSIPVSSTTLNNQELSSDSFFSSLCTKQQDLSTQLLPSLNAAGITVYPVQVSANGPTVLVAAATPSSTGTIGAKGFLHRSGLVAIPSMSTATPTCCSLTSTITVSATPTIATTVQVTNAVPGSCTFSNTRLSPSISTSSNSLPRTKPKFKALWESNLGTVTEPSGVSQIRSTDSPLVVASVAVDSVSDAPSLVVTNSASRAMNHNSVKRQSPILIGSKSIGQTPKRLAASAASAAAAAAAAAAPSSTGISVQSESERKSPNHLDGGSKKLLLVCSQSQQTIPTSNRLIGCSSTIAVNSTVTTATNSHPDTAVDSTLAAKAVTAHQLQAIRSRPDPDQSELVFLANPNNPRTSDVGVSGTGTERLVAIRPENQSPGPTGQQAQNQSGGLFVPNRGATVVLVNHNTNPLNSTPSGPNCGQPDSTRTMVPMSTVSDSETSAASVLAGNQKIMLDISKRIIRTDEAEQVGDDEARRRAKRRERNRVAAAKCRQRRQDQILELQHRVSMLNKTGEELRSSIHSLDEERCRLEELIRQHGRSGCTAADEFLSSTANSTELLLKNEQPTVMDTGDNEEDTSLDPSGAFGSTVDVMMTNAAVYSNSGPTTSCSSPTSPASRSALKLDPESADTGSRASARTDQQRLIRTGTANASTNGAIPSVKADQFDAAEPSPADSGSDGSDTRQMRTASQSSSHSPQTTKTRPVVARPCTLLPPKRTLEKANANLSAADSVSTGATLSATGAAATSIANTTATVIPGSNASTPLDTILSRLWPADLISYSSILTPSAWKVISKDFNSGTITPGTFTPTGTPGSTMGNNSSMAAAATALLFSNPSFSSSLTNSSTSANLFVNSLINSMQTAPAISTGSASTTRSVDVTSLASGSQANANNSSLITTPLLCLPEVIGTTSTSSSTATNNQLSFVLCPLNNRDRTEQPHTSEELNATVTQ